jgi:preprotein translocase subunit YajC
LKLNKQKEHAGFYEFFSDIIFATMAIFVLLMTIFIVLAQESSPARKAKKQIEAVKVKTLEVADEIVSTEGKAKSLDAQIAKLARKDIQIAIAVDKTGSMEEELYNLKSAIQKLAQILPKVSESVSISVVSYRISERGRNDTVLFPMTRLMDSSLDNGKSYQQLVNFLSRQRHESGLAPILDATKQALASFDNSPDFKGHQVFMLLGDVGPYEESINGVDEITRGGEQRARQLVSSVGSWAKEKKNRNIIILFSGRDEVYKTGAGYGAARRHKHRVSMDLFKQIAVQAGQPKAYTENQSSMLADFLVAALKRQ